MYNPYNGYATAAQAQESLSLQSYVAKVMRRVFGKMFLGRSETLITFKEVFKRQIPINEETED